MTRPIITLTTDYGTNDHLVGVLKGVILSINPEVNIVDITHSILAHDILDGALTLSQAYKYFPFEDDSSGGGGPRRRNSAAADSGGRRHALFRSA